MNDGFFFAAAFIAIAVACYLTSVTEWMAEAEESNKANAGRKSTFFVCGNIVLLLAFIIYAAMSLQ